MCPWTFFGEAFCWVCQRYCNAPVTNILANLEKKTQTDKESDLKFRGINCMFVAVEMSNHAKKLGRFINFKYFEHQQFVLLYLSNDELDPVFLCNYLNFVISVRMLSWVDIFIETFVIALSVICSCSEVPTRVGYPWEWGHKKRNNFPHENLWEGQGRWVVLALPSVNSRLSPHGIWLLVIYGKLISASRQEKWNLSNVRQKYIFIHCVENPHQVLCCWESLHPLFIGILLICLCNLMLMPTWSGLGERLWEFTASSLPFSLPKIQWAFP